MNFVCLFTVFLLDEIILCLSKKIHENQFCLNFPTVFDSQGAINKNISKLPQDRLHASFHDSFHSLRMSVYQDNSLMELRWLWESKS